MKLKTFLLGLGLAAGSLTLLPAYANTAGGKTEYDNSISQAKAKYKEERKACDSLAGNEKDVCIEEAKANEKKAKADAHAKYKGTEKAAYQARMEYARADYAVAKEKCDAKNGNDKDICIKAAKDMKVKAEADARLSHRKNEAEHVAYDEKRRADYKLEVEKCDSLSGAAKDSCVANAKTRFNM
jgi:hypothetical protein